MIFLLLLTLDHTCQETRRLCQGRLLLRSLPGPQSGGTDGRRRQVTGRCCSCRRRSVQSHVRLRRIKGPADSGEDEHVLCRREARGDSEINLKLTASRWEDDSNGQQFYDLATSSGQLAARYLWVKPLKTHVCFLFFLLPALMS